MALNFNPNNFLLNFVLSWEIFAVVLYSLPYTNVGKQNAIGKLSASPTFEWLRRNAYLPVGAGLFYQLRNETNDKVRRERLKFALLLLAFLKRSHDRIAGSDLEALVKVEASAEEREYLNFAPPSKDTIRWITRAYRAVFDPVFIGEENIPRVPFTKPIIFVSNHSILGFEYPVLLSWMYERHDIFFRVLADHSHFQVPVNAQFLRQNLGAVDGTRRNVDLLMERKLPVFVFPGGARETFKRTTDAKYELFWWGRDGFVETAIKWGATIVPICNVGTEHMVDVVADLPLGWIPIPFLYGSDRTLPLIVPKKLQRIYFQVCPPIETEAYKGRQEVPEIVKEVKERAQHAVERGIKELEARRLKDYPHEQKDVASEILAKYIKSLMASRL